MRTPDLIAIGYFGYLVIAAGLVPRVAGRRRIVVGGLALAAMALVAAAGWIWPPAHPLRDWLPAIWLVLGYWLPGGLLHEPMPHLEAWLRASDRWLREWPSMRWARAQPRWLSALCELAYSLVHPFVPAGLIVLLLTGFGQADRFWTAILLAGYACYGTLPWLQARPPRFVEPDAGPAPVSAAASPSGSGRPGWGLRAWNERFLDHLGVHANTFPSGHVAVALVVALAVLDAAPIAGAIFLPCALLIAAATVLRRYHYTADVAFGLVVALVCWRVAAVIMPT